MAQYDDPNTYDGMNWFLKNVVPIASPFAAAMAGAAKAPLVAAGIAGFSGGNFLGHYLDGRNGMGVDPETGRELDVFDKAAGIGNQAESWVQNKFHSEEGDGSFGDIVGGIAGGTTAGALSAFGGASEGLKDGARAAVNLFGGMFD